MTPARAVNLSVSNIKVDGLDDVLPTPFEINLLKNNINLENKLKTITLEKINSCLKLSRRPKDSNYEKLSLLPISHVLVPKKDAFDFRKIAIIRPEDLAVYQALAIMIGEPFEKARSKIARGRIYSYRFKPKLNKGQLFNPIHNIRSFQAKSAEISNSKRFNYMVKCDVANFYDRINIHRIESTLNCIDGLNERVVSLINQILLFWAKRNSFGLPVGSNGSRVIAEVALFNVDQSLAESKFKFIRFVDDFRIFTKTATEAHSALAKLIDLLDREGLFINTRKTSISRLNVTEPVETRSTKVNDRAEITNFRDFRIVAGYGGTIPIKFRKPTPQQQEKLINIDIKTSIEEILKNDFAKPEQIRDVLNSIVVPAIRIMA